MTDMIIIYTDANTSGFLFHAEKLSGEQQERVRRAADAYNAQDAWQKRGGNGSVEVFSGFDEAVAAHNKLWENEPEEQLSGSNDLLEYYGESDDGLVLEC